MTTMKWISRAATAAFAICTCPKNALAQNATYIDCSMTYASTGATYSVTFAIIGNSAQLWDNGRWISPCLGIMSKDGPCAVSVTDFSITFSYAARLRSDADWWTVNKTEINRSTGKLLLTYLPRVDGIDKDLETGATGKCVRGENPVTRPRAF